MTSSQQESNKVRQTQQRLDIIKDDGALALKAVRLESILPPQPYLENSLPLA
ncbi:hypothetical protein [Dasania marina]|uniref:hypothetical protein n=1 Tax=Dasania marina TaxID=471499 RepID=UPI0030DB0C70|tara:strand:+ start:24910 stop:25065 length:156 start_codon:yes stop_codon:yes gene_type:complete